MEQNSPFASTTGRDIQTVQKTGKVTLVLLRPPRSDTCAARLDHILLTYFS